MKDWNLLKIILALLVFMLVSFWSVVIVGGIYIHRTLETISAVQEQIETAVDSLSQVDIKDINTTIESLKEAGGALESLMGFLSGGDTSKSKDAGSEEEE